MADTDTDTPKGETPKSDAERRREWDKQDREVAQITRTVEPESDAPSRANVTGPGSGADGGSAHHEK
jgi:hypothetical protein